MGSRCWSGWCALWSWSSGKEVLPSCVASLSYCPSLVGVGQGRSRAVLYAPPWAATGTESRQFSPVSPFDRQIIGSR